MTDSSLSLWMEGARLRTLPAAVAPVIIGTVAAWHLGGLNLMRAMLALLVALFLQIGVNFANDYSDGIRGTDDHRVGPPRLTGSGAVSPRVVLSAALACFALAAISGLALVALAGQWWMIGIGAAAIVAAWFYTGGRNPYGYMGVGLSELLVFVFFGLVATVGTTYLQTGVAPWWVWALASGAGALSVALLMVNNIRDRDTDIESGKTTLVVRIGGYWSRIVYDVCVLMPVAMMLVAMSGVRNPGAMVTGAAIVLVPAFGFIQQMFRATWRAEYLALLRNTGLFALMYSLVLVWVLL